MLPNDDDGPLTPTHPSASREDQQSRHSESHFSSPDYPSPLSRTALAAEEEEADGDGAVAAQEHLSVRIPRSNLVVR